MKIYTIGFTKRSAEEFFNTLRDYKIRQVVDIRENVRSQLSGFTKKEDLTFFVKEILGGSYIHLPELAPDKRIRENYKRSKNWQEYESNFLRLMEQRDTINWLKQNRDIFVKPLVLLCSEPLPDRCHRRLVAELLKESIFHDAEIIHL